MRKIFMILALILPMTVFTACDKDKDDDDKNSNGAEQELVGQELIGTWIEIGNSYETEIEENYDMIIFDADYTGIQIHHYEM